MSHPIRSIVRPLVVVGGLCLVFAGSARAQEALEQSPSAPQFLARYDFHMEAAALSGGDPRFMWDTHWGGDFDFVDYVRGRLSFLTDYQAVLGREFQPFDPNQGNYILEASSSIRRGGTEFVGVLHHVSRHLGDRPKRFAIAHNVVEVRLLRRIELNQVSLAVRVEGGKVTMRSDWIDYSWNGLFDVRGRRPLGPRTALIGRVFGEVRTVNRDIPHRGTQYGGRIEAGLRILGGSGAMEFFGGFERVIDADPLDRQPRQWAVGGFRLVNR